MRTRTIDGVLLEDREGKKVLVGKGASVELKKPNDILSELLEGDGPYIVNRVGLSSCGRRVYLYVDTPSGKQSGANVHFFRYAGS